MVSTIDGTTWTEETRSGTGIGATDGASSITSGGVGSFSASKARKRRASSAALPAGVVWSEYGKETVGLSKPAGRGVQPIGMAYGGCHCIAFGNHWNDDATQTECMIVATVSPAQ